MVNSTFWKNKTVLVTGCTGFKGAWLCLWLSAMGARVVGTARGTGSPNGVFAAEGLAEKITLERADIRDESRILEIFAAHKPQVVFHLAAQPLVGLSYECPDETYAINVIGTLNVLAGIRATAECRCGIFVTTDRCAQQAANGQSRPNELLGGFDPYSNSKAASEILIATYRSTFLLPQGKGIAMGRSGNVVGGGDWAKDRLIPDCIRAMQAGEALTIRNPNAAKPWQYVLDILAGYLCLGQKLWEQPQVFSQAWNFRPQDEPMLTVGDMVQVLRDAYDPDYHDIRYGQPPRHGLEQVQRDESPTRAMLDWHPLVSAADAVAHAARWYQAAAKQNAAAETMAQLQEYRKMCEQA